MQPRLDELPSLDEERVELAVLSGLQLKLRERELAKLERKRKALRERKPYTRKRGTVHPNKKKATRRRLLAKRWATNPFGCVIRGYGAHSIDRAKWELYITPLWARYDSVLLSVVKYGRPFGTKIKPYTIYSLDIMHATEGVVYCGASQELYDLSTPDGVVNEHHNSV